MEPSVGVERILGDTGWGFVFMRRFEEATWLLGGAGFFAGGGAGSAL